MRKKEEKKGRKNRGTKRWKNEKKRGKVGK